jgi:protein arginine N-methyltransferase 2
VLSSWIDPLIYDVACNLAEMHMDDVGLQVRSPFQPDPCGTGNEREIRQYTDIQLVDVVTRQTEWKDVLVDDATAVEIWNGVKRSYWNLPVYRMPVASYSM